MHDPARDFDFWIGAWTIHNRRLVRRLAGCDEWETFTASSRVRALPGGIGNIDDWIADAWRPGYVGGSLRVHDPRTRRWSIYWLENQTGGLDAATGHLNPPVVGGFEGGVGTFLGRETWEGRPILCRFVWSDITPDAARWEQAFSVDEGASWEVNWTMRMSRLTGAPPAPSVPAARPAAP